ncbi:MAG: MFS transporter [Candidatus Nanopelagicales bacterium]
MSSLSGSLDVTPAQRLSTYALSVIVGLSLFVVTGLAFLVLPMAEDLGLDDSTVQLALVAPAIAALLVVFVAGRAGDMLGERRTIIAAGLIFTVGAGVVASATNDPSVIVGLAFCGAGAIAIQVVALSLLNRVAPDGLAHVRAFTTFGMVFPLAFLLFPIATAYVLGIANWRWVPVIWVVGGAVVIVMSFRLLERDRPVGAPGEWGSPILAGIALATGSRMLQEISRQERNLTIVAITASVCTLATIACVLILKSARSPGLSLRPLSGAMMPPLLFGIAVIALIQILTYVTIALEYFYDMSPLEASFAIAPAQIGAVIGAKLVASRSIRVWGIARSSRGLLLVTGLVMLLLVFFQSGTTVWFLIMVATLFSLTGVAALTVMNMDIMGRAPEGSAGVVSAFRTAASSLGAAASMVVLGLAVLSSVSVADEAADIDESQLEQLAAGLRLDGLVGCIIAVSGWAVLFLSARRNRRNLRSDAAIKP